MEQIQTDTMSADNPATPNASPTTGPKLWKIFWLTYVAPVVAWHVALNHMYYSQAFISTMISVVEITGLPPKKAIWLSVIAPLYCYSIFCWHLVWKYARNTNISTWGHFAKLVTLAHMLWYASKAVSIWAGA
ncbi:hypothetical protein OH686_01375 [Pseudomonas sp. SO81]|nr:hypothetical protein OH686_01375 [Pseudomonas sp. SO81]